MIGAIATKTTAPTEAMIEFIIMLTEQGQIQWAKADEQELEGAGVELAATSAYNGYQFAYVFSGDIAGFAAAQDNLIAEDEGIFYPYFSHPVFNKLSKVILDQMQAPEINLLIKALGMPV